MAVAPPAGAQEDDGAAQSLRGTLVDADREPVSGVDITVTTPGGAEVATVTTDDAGAWAVPLDEPGDYVVTLGALPDGIELTDAERGVLTPTVRPGQDRTVIFPIGERVVDSVSRLDRLANLFIDGLRFGLLIALASLGLSLVFGVTGLVNFAHGELVAFGAIVAWWIERGWGPLPAMPLVLAGLIAIAASGGLGAVLETGLFARLRRRRTGDIAAMVVSIGLAFFLRHLYLIFFGSRPDFYLDYRIQSTFAVGPFSLTPKAWASIVISAAVLLAFGWALKNTRLGTATRAVAVNKDLAESSGIDVDRVILATWVSGAALAGLGGILFGIAESVRWDMGNDVLLLMFAAVVLGGLGTAYGAMVGGIVVGIVTQMSTYWFPGDMKLLFALGVLVIVLLVRPQGILGVRERIG
ncbi:MAG TPA: branched-chain amino acid ABC transporter permease [Acidimicrobiales bacterium]|nr:branched-chain amino acid ABC transporter permease [Acidimicrobiales bacterium]